MQSLMYTKKKYRVRNVAISDLVAEPILAASLTVSQVQKFSVNDTPSLLAAVQQSPESADILTVIFHSHLGLRIVKVPNGTVTDFVCLLSIR